ncbi:hypothetical protein ACFX2B_039404 [Malus domestica]
MACPHASGVAAYIKTIRLDWSPAAIKSSLMTTTKPMNGTNISPDEFAYGSGHIDPAKILPGPKVDIKVVPEVLLFKSLNEEKKFNLTIVGTGLPDGSHVSAELIWSDETHSIRSPILISSSVM